MRSLGQKILIVVLSLIGFILIAWIGSAGYSAWQGYKWQKQTDAFQDSLRRPYREDTYGGKTPEETWAMFLSALRAGDVEQASKYFVVEKQEEMKERVESIKADNRLEQWVETIQDIKIEVDTEQVENKQYYSYKYFNQEFQRDLWSSVIFTLNPYTQIWKISVL